MINFRFVNSQIKNIRIPLVVFIVILIILLIPALTQSSISASVTTTKEDTSTSTTFVLGAGTLLNNIFFGVPGFVVIFTFSIILTHILVTKEIDRGYLGSWLTTPMSRKTILNSKFFVLISAILILYSSTLLFQIIIFPLKFIDFNWELFARILLYNFALIILAMFWATINWTIVCFFNKSSIALSSASAVSIAFIIFAALVLFSYVPSLEYLQYFKYLTITSLMNSPLNFNPINELGHAYSSSQIVFAELQNLKILDFAWQLPLMLILTIALFPLGNYFVVRKDLYV